MNITWAMLLIGLGLLGVIAVQFVMKKAKPKARKVVTALGIVVVIVGLIPALGIFAIPGLSNTVNFQSLSVGQTGQGTGNGQVLQPLVADVTGCDLGTKTTVTLSGQDKYNTSASGGTHRFRIDGGAWTTVSDAGTLTASPGQKVDVLWYNGATTGYLSLPESYIIPCSGAKTYSPLLAINGTITETIKDDRGVVVDGLTSNNFTLVAGDVKVGLVSLSGVYQREWSHGFVAVVEYNKTALDNVRLFDMSGNELPPATVPQAFGGRQVPSVRTSKGYDLPGLFSIQNLEFKIELDADNDLNPNNTGEPANVTITLYGKNYFINEDNGGMWDGPSAQDEDNAVTRTGQYEVEVFFD